MRRRTKIVLAITFMVTALVSAFSYIYISQLLRQRVTTAHETAALLASQLVYVANNAAPDLASTRVDTSNPEAVRRAIAYYLGTDRALNNMLDSVVGNFPIVYDAAIVDADGKAILHTNPDLIGKQVARRPDFQIVQDAKFRQQLRMVYNPATVYDVRMPLELDGAPFGSIRLGVSTVLLKNELTPRLRHAVIFSTIAILLSLVLAAALSHIALGPLEGLSRSLDSATTGGADAIVAEHEHSYDEYGLVSLKIAHLGRQMRDTKEIFSALKENVDQVMANLQDGLMLFTRDSRVVLVSASVERFLGRPRHELLGRTAKEIFTRDSQLGALVLESFHMRHAVGPREIETATGKRVQMSLDHIEQKGTRIAVLTLRDIESARRMKDEIEISRRLSFSGRTTGGVAHEVKNPVNAIVLHLQLLQGKLQDIDPDTRRHMDIIDSEIHRLDRVVQILVDFMRTRDLHLEEIDLRGLLEDVASLAAPDAQQHGVTIANNLPSEPLTVKVDTDFMKQAILNVVLNGVQAMPQGGTLAITARREQEIIVAEIHDQGGGIPPEVQDKIFELYFTTKKGGTGLGLAQTYKILNWHDGTVDFESAPGQGTTFRLRLPQADVRSESLKEASVRT